MTGYEKRGARAVRVVRADLATIGRELLTARLSVDLSQRRASAAAGLSKSAWGRIERGEDQLEVMQRMALALDVVGLDLRVRAYPGGSALRDEAHLALLERFRRELPSGSAWRTEVAFPDPGDRRAWDAVVRIARVHVGLEAETRGRDSQGLQRRVALKKRDGMVDYVVLLLADTRHNRSFLRASGIGFMADFPVPGRVALQRFRAGMDPGGSSIILI